MKLGLQEIDWESVGSLLALEDAEKQGQLLNGFINELAIQCKTNFSTEIQLHNVRKELKSDNIELLKCLTMDEN